MKLSRILLLSTVGILLLANGCVFDDTSTEAVINDWMVVPFNEYRTSPNIDSEAVCDQTKQAFLDLLERNNVEPEDVISAHLVKGRYKVTRINSNHDWTIQGKVMVYRQDDPAGDVTDGPALFVKWSRESLEMLLRNPPHPARTWKEGVDIMDDAMMALLNGEDPRVVLTFRCEDIVPEPSEMHPLEFDWEAHARIQLVIRRDVTE
jgi:hypothetical protein